MLNVKSRLQIRIFTRKSLFDWKIMLNFAALNIKKVKINIKKRYINISLLNNKYFNYGRLLRIFYA